MGRMRGVNSCVLELLSCLLDGVIGPKPDPVRDGLVLLLLYRKGPLGEESLLRRLYMCVEGRGKV
jgi:hypothetical protein